MVAVTEQQEEQTGVETSDFDDDSCKEELNTIITTTSQRKHTLKSKKKTIAHYRGVFKAHVEEGEALENEIKNLTTKILEIEDTCTGYLSRDCCQVYSLINVNVNNIHFLFQVMIASNSSAETGLYEIKDPCTGDRSFNYAKIHVRCDMETDGGGWIVIQRRITNGTVNFNRNWEDYVNGFGDLEGEFWIGLENMHELTKQAVELQVTVWNDNKTITWNYTTFRVAGSENNYRLTLRGGTGDGDTDALYYSNGRYFSTFDRDNDGYTFLRCGSSYQAGWWYYGYRYAFINRKSCSDANLNGRHESSNLPDNNVARIHWATPGNTFTNTEMKIRSTTCGLGS